MQQPETTATRRERRGPSGVVRQAPVWLRRAVPIAGLVAAGAVVVFGFGLSHQDGPMPQPLAIAVQARLHGQLAEFDRNEAVLAVATIRWGATGGPQDEPGGSRSMPVVWDGYAALDCGTIEESKALGMELQRSRDGRALDGDRLGPVVQGDQGDQRVYWRSATRRDWDGVRLQIAACRAGKAHPLGASLRVVTPDKTWVVRLDTNLDRFVSVPVTAGNTIDVHLATVKDPETLQRARVSVAPVPAEKRAPMAELRENAPVSGPPHL